MGKSTPVERKEAARFYSLLLIGLFFWVSGGLAVCTLESFIRGNFGSMFVYAALGTYAFLYGCARFLEE